jgi:FdhD protein
MTRDVEVLRWRDGSTSREHDVVAEEARMVLHVEPLGVLDIVMTPESLREFILGHLYCEGLITDVRQVLEVTVAERGDHQEVLVELDPATAREATGPSVADGARRRGLIQTECGTPSMWPERPLRPISDGIGMAASVIAGVPRAVRDRSQLFVETGAFHYAFLVDTEGTPTAEAFDIGRHTAVDKVVGRALTGGVDLRRNALYTTGRISTDVARKCLQARIPLVMSRGAPLSGAISLARGNGLGMVGFLRGGRFNAYAGEDHIVWD